MSFSDFGLDERILQSLEKMGFTAPTPVQSVAIPQVMAGRDIIALAETGSGKTAACAIPVCHRVDISQSHIQALIVVPTRELALQYATETQRIGRAKRVKAFAVYGGDDWDMQQAKLNHKVHVLVATPGRLIDLVFRRLVDLSQVSTFILDEADEMLNMGFVEDIEFLFGCLVHEHETLLFSATMPDDIKRMAERYMKDPLELRLTEKKAAPEGIEHLFVYCKHHERLNHLQKCLQKEEPNQSLIFCESRISCEQVYKGLKGKIQGVDFLHGGLSQDLRSSITSKFRRGAISHMVATDVAARGLDFSGVTHVFLFQLPKDIDTYIHRSGRTGRSGRKGRVISFVTDRELGLQKRVSQRLNSDPQWIGRAPSKGPSSSSGQKKPAKTPGSAPKKRAPAKKPTSLEGASAKPRRPSKPRPKKPRTTKPKSEN